MYEPKDFFDLTKTDFPSIFKDINYAWEILRKLEKFICSEGEKLSENEYTKKKDKNNVWIGKGTVIAETAEIEGPAIIGHDTEIRQSAFIRKNVIIGNGVVVGNSSEVKNSFIFDKAKIPHFNYVGDSVIGYKAHLGAGVILSNINLKLKGGNVFVGKIDTGLRKFSSILGDEAEIGCNSVVYPGATIGKKSVVYPLLSVRSCIPQNYVHKENGKMERRIEKEVERLRPDLSTADEEAD